MTLAAAVIVRDGAATLRRAVESIRPHVDEVCVLDTGSVDGTLGLLAQLAGEPGAPIVVERARWVGDYAQARNQSFDLASSEYLLWMDDDETLEGGEHLRRLLDDRQPDALYVRRVDLLAGTPGLVQTQLRLRVVRAGLVRWKGVVHERLGPLPNGATRLAAHPRKARVVHVPVRQAGRHDHRPLIEAGLAADPNDAYLRFELGRCHFADNNDHAAQAEFERAAALADPHRPDEAALAATALDHLALIAADRGDPAAATAHLDQRDEIRARLNADPFHRHCQQLERATPIKADDPLWQYANDALPPA